MLAIAQDCVHTGNRSLSILCAEIQTLHQMYHGSVLHQHDPQSRILDAAKRKSLTKKTVAYNHYQFHKLQCLLKVKVNLKLSIDFKQTKKYGLNLLKSKFLMYSVDQNDIFDHIF